MYNTLAFTNENPLGIGIPFYTALKNIYFYFNLSFINFFTVPNPTNLSALNLF